MSFRKNHHFIIFLFALSYLFGGSYTIFVNHDTSFASDEQSYLRMARGEYDVQTTHRYRVVVPVMARATAEAIQGVLQVFQPGASEQRLPLGSGFFVVNLFFMTLSGLFIYLTCISYGASVLSSFIAMTAVLTSSYAGYITGIALTDSLYLLIFVLTLYGIKVQSAPALLFCIFIGPLAKESFVFLAPLIILFGNRAIPWLYQVPLFLFSAFLTFGLRYLIDQKIGFTAEAGMVNAFHHFYNVGPTFRRLFSLGGLMALWSSFGFFYLVLIFGFFPKLKEAGKWMGKLDAPALGLVLVVIVHIFLSGEIGRMAYFGAPVFAVVVALVLHFHPFFRTWITINHHSENNIGLKVK
jgi:hypothetical protein